MTGSKGSKGAPHSRERRTHLLQRRTVVVSFDHRLLLVADAPTRGSGNGRVCTVSSLQAAVKNLRSRSTF